VRVRVRVRVRFYIDINTWLC